MTTNIPSLTAERLFANADLYPVQLTSSSGQFIVMSRATYRESIFLDQRLIPVDNRVFTIPWPVLNKLAKDHGQHTPPAAYIFQTALCGSTLLARALDCAPITVAYREPICLRNLAMEACSGQVEPEWQPRLELMHRLLSRTYPDGRQALAKANIPCNFILPEILGCDGNSRGLLLYMDLKPFLALVLRGGEQRDLWLKTLLEQMAGKIFSQDMFKSLDAHRLTSIQVYSTIWIAQIQMFRQALEMHKSRLRSLNCDSFYRSPRAVIEAACRFFGIPVTQNHLDEIMERPLWNEHAKMKGRPFTNAKREELLAGLYQRFEKEIAEGLSFANQLYSSGGLPVPLDNALVE